MFLGSLLRSNNNTGWEVFVVHMSHMLLCDYGPPPFLVLNVYLWTHLGCSWSKTFPSIKQTWWLWGKSLMLQQGASTEWEPTSFLSRQHHSVFQQRFYRGYIDCTRQYPFMTYFSKQRAQMLQNVKQDFDYRCFHCIKCPNFPKTMHHLCEA